MINYTPEGIREMQSDMALALIDRIDDKLAKTNRRLGILILLGVAAMGIAHKDFIISQVKKLKGE